MLTADGEIEVQRRYFWAPGAEGVYPADAAVGVDRGAVSPGAQEILCTFGRIESFRLAAADARRIGNLPVAPERLRQVVEATARQVRQAREAGRLPAVWQAADAVVPAPGAAAAGAATRVYQGTDGVLVPTVSQAEKDKRRQQHVARRRQRQAAGLTNTKALPPPQAGSDQRFKEMKIGLFYNQDKTLRHAFATEGDSSAYGPLLQTYAAQIALDQAGEVISLVDGAKWIAAQITWALGVLRVLLLDFYHLSQHVHGAALACLGEGPAAQAWALARLEEIKTLGVAPVLLAIDALNKKVRARSKRQSLQSLRDYLVSRLDMLHYPQALAKGWDIGSGPTEALCKTLTLRLKRPGMKWDRDHAADLMNLQALYESGQAPAYWQSRRQAA